ncbi:MAG: hypothetical protein GX977_04105 [Firmicutes bacterium]|nr:hypothetical protein [Bacillota bacterium]
MSTNDNQKPTEQRFIEIGGEQIPVTEEVYLAYKRPLWRERKRKERETVIGAPRAAAFVTWNGQIMASHPWSEIWVTCPLIRWRMMGFPTLIVLTLKRDGS